MNKRERIWQVTHSIPKGAVVIEYQRAILAACVQHSVVKSMNKRERIWQVVHSIPKGSVASYGQVARMAGLPGYARYVGHTMKMLPNGTKLPWHRVVNSQGRLSFPNNSRAYQTQKTKLESEGVVFINGKFSLKKYGWNQDDT